MKTSSYCFLLCCFFLFVIPAKGNDLVIQLAATQELSQEDFLASFPYGQFLAQEKERPVKYYEEVERLLTDYQRPAGPFFLRLAEEQLISEPIDLNDKKQLLDQLHLGQFLVQHEEREFQIASDIVLEHLAEHLEQGFQQGILQKTDAEIMYLVRELKRHEYGVSIPVSDLEKGLHHLREGNLQYIWSRLWFDHPILCVVGITFLFLLLHLLIKKIRK